MRSVGGIRSSSEPRRLRCNRRVASVGEFYARRDSAQLVAVRGAARDHDGNDRSAKRRPRHLGMPAYRHRSVFERHRADTDLSVAWRPRAIADFGRGSWCGDAAARGRGGSWSGSDAGDQWTVRRIRKYIRFVLPPLRILMLARGARVKSKPFKPLVATD